MKKTIAFIVCGLSILASGCSMTQRCESSDEFYQFEADWDYSRIPLLEPYEANNFFNDSGWIIQLRPSDDVKKIEFYASIRDVEDIAVHGNTILVFSTDSTVDLDPHSTNILHWFVLIPEKKTEMGFSSEEDFLTYIRTIGVQEPDWINIRELFREYDQTGRLDWIADCQPED